MWACLTPYLHDQQGHSKRQGCRWVHLFRQLGLEVLLLCLDESLLCLLVQRLQAQANSLSHTLNGLLSTLHDTVTVSPFLPLNESHQLNKTLRIHNPSQ